MAGKVPYGICVCRVCRACGGIRSATLSEV